MSPARSRKNAAPFMIRGEIMRDTIKKTKHRKMEDIEEDIIFRIFVRILFVSWTYIHGYILF